MSEILWRLRHPHEFFWEPIRKRLFRARQLRRERDYWKERVEEYARMKLDEHCEGCRCNEKPWALPIGTSDVTTPDALKDIQSYL